ncbi:S41 family peptidase [Flavihumibacter sp. CACIAM 22H1]|uniref:S41 family peptidase n=1 Tax=Flavihumibacter sp. CACIAM 22H1 TaxID=1812911 RepID=UPI000AB08F46|nr:S41 family peptidase [Flavihumibacter sp. CACIAM 22H1]
MNRSTNRMKITSISLLITVLLLTGSFTLFAQPAANAYPDSLAYFNKLLSPPEMKEDLRVFYTIRQQVNSGLYIYRTKKQIDSLYGWANKAVSKPLLVKDFYKIILQLTDFEGSVHNYTEPSTGFMNALKKQPTFFPYPLTYINGAIIFDGKHPEIPAGSRIRSMNGRIDKEMLPAFYKYFPADGFTQTEKRSASVEQLAGWRYFIEYGATKVFKIDYQPPGSAKWKSIEIPAVSFAEQEANKKNRYSAPVADKLNYKLQAPYSFEMIRPDAGLLNLRWFGFAGGSGDPAFQPYVLFLDSVFRLLEQKQIPNLVIDIRNNPGGSDPLFEQPVMYLTDKSFKENLETRIIFDPSNVPFENYFWGVSTTERMDSAGLAAGKAFLNDYFEPFKEGRSRQQEKYNPVYYPKSPGFKGKLYLLINENVASAASHFASLVKAYARNVTIVGVETVGGYYVHNGHVSTVYELPNSAIKTKFSVVYVVQDAPELPDQPKGRGVLPHYEIWPQLDDFLKQRDTQLEFVLKLIEKK